MKLKFTFLLMMLAGVLMASAQASVKVTGTVYDSEGEPLIGVSITPKGNPHGVITDFDGNYEISVVTGSTLVYSYVGYDPAERKVTAAGVIDVELSESSTVLDEMVVVGYGVQKKSSVTGSISQVKAEDIENRTVTSPQAALQGKTAGVQVVNTSSAPGSSPTIRVRGYSSNVASDPLYVVDGVRLSDISGLDPNDIASIEVLKDAASAAIYGAEAGNGVVLISTKRGSASNGRIQYDFQYTWERTAKVPRMLNSEQYIEYMTEGNIFTEDYLLKNWDGRTNTSWIDEAFETGNMQRHNISFTNGNEKGNYYLSLSYMDNNGIVGGDKDKYERLTAAINGEYDIKSWLKVGTTNQIEKYRVSQVSTDNEYGSLISGVLLLDPLTPFLYAPDQLPLNMLNAQKNGKTLLTDKNGNYYSSSRFISGENFHPFIMRDNGSGSTGGFNVNGSIFADFKPFKGFTFTSRLGYRLSASHQSNVSLPFYGNATQSGDYVSMNAQNSQTVYYQWENFANYFRQFGVNTITAMAGISYSESTSSYTQGSLNANDADALKKIDPLFWYLNYGSSSAIKGVGGEKTRGSKLSYFGRVSYEYDNRYHIQASLRADAADLSKLPLENRWGYFPAV
ncbi:MAG: SusC/RagA family TonB-linked outer membrane protein, partial [Muribaculaceae bacterium]|nr:SusC/RagA family TonB-linked outer membrane protein [Muribaculaceae bacterium]